MLPVDILRIEEICTAKMFIAFGVISIDAGGVNCHIHFIGSRIFSSKVKVPSKSLKVPYNQL